MVKKINKKNWLKENFLDSIEFLRSSKNFIFFGILLFLVGAFIGLIVPPTPDVLVYIQNYVKKILEATSGMGLFELILFIFYNNLSVGFYSILFGSILGILPLVFAVGNGYMLGFISSIAISQLGINSLWKLVPHGIFELPAIFSSLGIGFRFGMFIFRKEKLSFWDLLKKSLKAFLLVILPLFLVAAIIEGALIFFA